MNDFLTIQSPGPNPAETTQPIAMNGSGNKSGSDVFGLLFQEKASINLEDNKIAGLRAEANDHDSAAPVEEDKSIKGIIRFRLHRQQGIDFLKSPLKEPERKGKQGITFLISPFKEPEPQGKNPEVNIKPPAGHPSEIDESIKGIKRSRPNIQQGLTFLKFPFKGPRLEGKNPTVKIKPPAGHPKDKRIKGLRAEAANDSAMPNETEDSIQGIKRSRPHSQPGTHFLKSPLKETGRKGENQEVQIKPPAGHPKDKRIKGLRAEAANDSAMPHAADESLKGTKRSRPNNHQGINSLKSPLKETGRKRENQEVQIKPAAGHPKDKNIEGLRAETADNDAAMRNETDESIKGIQRSLPNNHQGINLLKSRLKENRREAENPGIHIKPAAGHLKNKRIEGLHAEAADNDSTMSHEADESIKGSKRSRPNSQQGIHFLKSRLKEHGLKVENLKIKIKPIAGDTAKKKPTHSTEMAKEANKWNISQKQAVAGFLDPLAKISHQSKKAVKIRAPRDEIQSEKGGETNYESENSSKLSSQTEESSWSSEQGNSFLQDKEFFESLKKQNVFNNIQNLSGLLDKGLANENVMAPSHTKEAHILNLIQQISKVTDQLAIATTQKLEVEVEVAKLGKLMVDVTKSNNKINLQIQVENEEAKKWLQNQMSTLHERLTNQGVEIDKLNINLSSDHSGSDAGEKAFTGAGPDNRAQRFLLNKTQNASHDSMPLHLLQRNFGYNTVEVWA